MKLFGRFLRGKWQSILCFLLCFLLLALSFLLYDLPLAAVAYPMQLCLVLGILLLGFEFAAVLRRHRKMEEIEKHSYELLNNLPEGKTIGEEDYRGLALRLRRELEEMESRDSNRYWEALDYYTVWAHQIKTPIAAMKLRLEREDSELARDLRRELFRVEQYADMVMAYLRLEEGESDYVFRTLELDGLLRASIRRFSTEFISKHLTLRYEGTDKKLISDEKWLSFVVEQLLSNAVKYTNEGAISVSVEDNRLIIADTGIGIAPEDLPRIFEKGYTGYNGRKDKRASGIGLFLCRRVAGKLGMELRAESRLGEGTRMILTLGKAQM